MGFNSGFKGLKQCILELRMYGITVVLLECQNLHVQDPRIDRSVQRLFSVEACSMLRQLRKLLHFRAAVTFYFDKFRVISNGR